MINTVNDLAVPTTNFSMNSHKIIDLAAPTLQGDAVNKGFVENNFYANSTTLDSITQP